MTQAPPAPGLAETLPHVRPAPATGAAALQVPGYEVLGELGRGGMGVVYLARNVLMDRREVLKVVNKALLDKPGVMERFLREIRSAAMLRHNNVVQAYSAVQAGELLLFAMEYVEGEDLDKVVQRQGPLPIPYACHYVSQAAMGLQHAHEHQMVHRDVKPQNLMLSRQKKKHIVKVLDFGLAKAKREGEAVTDLTGFGAVMGTPAYMAPEQAQDAASADIRADIYSLGCTLYFLLTGVPPFTGKSIFAILQAHVSTEAAPLGQRCAEATPELAAVVAKMMAKDPARRYQKPIEAAQALAPFIKPGSAAQEGPTAPAARSDRPAALPVPPAVWDRPTVLPAGADAPAGRAPRESKTETLVPRPPRRAAPAPGSKPRKPKRRSLWRQPVLWVVLSVLLLGSVGGYFVWAINQPVTPKMVPVQGKVLWGSQPLTAGVVMFTPDAAAGNTSTLKPFGRIDANGTYRLSTDSTTGTAKNGAPPGRYIVTVMVPVAPPAFDPAYTDPNETPLSVEVTESPATGAYDLHLYRFIVDDKGEPIKFKVDKDSNPVKDDKGNLIPDEKGVYVYDDAG